MTGHGEKLTRNQEPAIAALLECATIKAAAQQIKVGEKTLRRWLGLPGFLAAYRAARRQLLEDANARVQNLAGEAVEALRRNLKCGKAADEIRAALGVLGHAQRATELTDLVARIEELERKTTPDEPEPEEAARLARETRRRRR